MATARATLPAVWKPHLAALMATLGGSGTATAAPPVSSELEAIERRLTAAIGERDLATYDTLVADDYVVIEAAGAVRTKAEVMASYRSGERGYRDLRIDDVGSRIFGDTAIVHARTFGRRSRTARRRSTACVRQGLRAPGGPLAGGGANGGAPAGEPAVIAPIRSAS